MPLNRNILQFFVHPPVQKDTLPILKAHVYNAPATAYLVIKMMISLGTCHVLLASQIFKSKMGNV